MIGLLGKFAKEFEIRDRINYLIKNLDTKEISGELSDISTASSFRFPVTKETSGELIKVSTVLGGAIATADATITISNQANSIGTITVAYSGSAEGDIDSLSPSNTYRHLSEGDWIEIATDGASTNTINLGFILSIRR